MRNTTDAGAFFTPKIQQKGEISDTKKARFYELFMHYFMHDRIKNIL